MSSDTVRSYLEQTLHYFDRPHTGQPTADLVGPWAWRGADLAADPHAWCRSPTSSSPSSAPHRSASSILRTPGDALPRTTCRSDRPRRRWRPGGPSR
ncbi:MAG: hypothetical protein R2746_15260 [Acidimicrobiales bacterium]